jgi:hypothetical protein
MRFSAMNLSTTGTGDVENTFEVIQPSAEAPSQVTASPP